MRLSIVDCRLTLKVGAPVGPSIRSIVNLHSSIDNYFASLCAVCFRHQRQYFRSSSRSLVFRLFFVVL